MKKYSSQRTPYQFFIPCILLIGLLSSCGKVSDGINKLKGDNEQNTPPVSQSVTPDEVNAFKISLHPVLINHCSGCHSTSQKEPNFAHPDPESAYQVIKNSSLIKLSSAENSRLVKKPLSGHNCVSTTCQTWSTNIEEAVVELAYTLSEKDTVVLDPDDGVDETKDDGVLNGIVLGTDDSSSSEEHKQAFGENLYPHLVEYCARCHGVDQSPLFAVADVAAAYSAVASNTLVNLSNPASSRIVKKPLTLHNCQNNCQQWSDEFKTDIENWANSVKGAINGAGITNASIVSRSLLLSDGKEDIRAGRIEDAIIAKYEFIKNEDNPLIATDTSGVLPSLDLTLSENVVWLPGKGVELTDPDNKERTKLVGGLNSSRKLYKQIGGPEGSKEFSIEAWIINASTALEGPARIVSYSLNAQNRNFTMGQDTSYYNFRNRSIDTDLNGSAPALESDNDDDNLKTELQHVVFTFNETDGRKIFVNGIETAYEGVDEDPATPTKISNWDDTYTFILGNEVPNNTERQWLGKMLFVAIHKRALSSEEILQNTLEGIVDRTILEFDISHLLDASGSTTSKIKMVVSEIDQFSYVFGNPTLITDIGKPNIPIKNLRVAVNGNIPAAAQSFRNVDLTVVTNNANISPLGAVIPKDTGPETDKFSLVFETLGNNNNVVVETSVEIPEDTSVLPPSNEEGIRTFAEINHTMAILTNVDKSMVNETYQVLEQQLPGIPNLDAFVSSNQIGIAKLSLDYCDNMINDTTLRDSFFGTTFEFDSPVTVAFSDQAKRDIVISNVVNKFVGDNLSTQPTLAEIQPDLDQLISELSANCLVDTDCDAERTNTIVKAVCASVLASAAISID